MDDGLPQPVFDMEAYAVYEEAYLWQWDRASDVIPKIWIEEFSGAVRLFDTAREMDQSDLEKFADEATE